MADEEGKEAHDRFRQRITEEDETILQYFRQKQNRTNRGRLVRITPLLCRPGLNQRGNQGLNR